MAYMKREVTCFPYDVREKNVFDKNHNIFRQLHLNKLYEKQQNNLNILNIFLIRHFYQ